MTIELSPRERDVLALYAKGLSLYETGRKLGISDVTVKEHIRRIRGKYEAAGRAAHHKIALRNRAIEDGLIDPRDGLGPPSSEGLLGSAPWSPVTSPTARKLRILYRRPWLEDAS